VPLEGAAAAGIRRLAPGQRHLERPGWTPGWNRRAGAPQ
jgi:hypothetical protein